MKKYPISKYIWITFGIMINSLPSFVMGAVNPPAGGRPINLSESSTLKDVAGIGQYYLNQAIIVIVGLCIVSFVWGIYKHFIKGGDSPEDRMKGTQYVLYSTVALFVILSFWGLVNILTNTFFPTQENYLDAPSGFEKKFEGFVKNIPNINIPNFTA